VFKNLAVLEPAFLDFNRREFFQRVEEVSYDEILGVLWAAIREPGCDVLDFANLETFKTTLELTWSSVYFRLHPGSPGDQRDYVLSKLYEFIVTAISCSRYAFDGIMPATAAQRRAWRAASLGVTDPSDVTPPRTNPLRSRSGSLYEDLESALDGLPPDIVSNAHSKFDVVGLVRVLSGTASRITLNEVLSSAGLRRPTTLGRAGLIPSNDRLSKKRRKLWKQAEDLDIVRKDVCNTALVDQSQFSNWLRGKLPETSEVSRRIERAISELLTNAKHRNVIRSGPDS
jgi:hypothetical protein